MRRTARDLRTRFAPTVLRARLLEIFTPASLGSNGANVMWFDPSDLSTMFQDAAGTVPVTAPEQPVGLWLDKGKGGPVELLTGDNSNFTNGIGSWASSPAFPVTLSRVNQELVITQNEANGRAMLAFSSVPGRSYRATADLRTISGPLVQMVLTSNSSGGGNALNNSVPGATGSTATRLVTPFFVALNTTSYLTIGTNFRGADVFGADNISIREIPGYHATQPVSTRRPTYKAGEGLHWLAFDGVDDFMETEEGILVNDNWLVSYGALNTIEIRSEFRGPWRWLTDGGSPTELNTNLLEEYGGNMPSVMRRRAIVSRASASTGSIIDNPQGLPVDGTAFVAWVNKGTTELGYGSYFTGSDVGNIAPPSIVGPRTGAGSLSIGRGYAGALMQYRNYGIVFVWGDVSTANRIAINKYMAAKTGVTI